MDGFWSVFFFFFWGGVLRVFLEWFSMLTSSVVKLYLLFLVGFPYIVKI